MDARSFILGQHARLHFSDVSPEPGTLAERILGGMTDEQMRMRPGRGLNPLAWVLWHMARVEDVCINLVVIDGRQVFDEAWASRMGVRRWDIGTGMSEDEVRDLAGSLNVAAARAYRSAVGRRTRDIVTLLPLSVWEEIIAPADTARAAQAGAFGPHAAWVEKAWQNMSRATRLGAAAIAHNAMHLGEAATIRGQAGLPVGR
jgi:hypothetical protein